MKYGKFNKYEKQAMQKEFVRNAMAGEGVYLFKNSLNSEVILPKDPIKGSRSIRPNEEFEGDSYFFKLVGPVGGLRFIREITSPEQQKHQLLEEESKMEEKLILDQPSQVTNDGTVEHVISKAKVKKKPLNETKVKAKAEISPDTLISESPEGDGIVIVE